MHACAPRWILHRLVGGALLTALVPLLLFAQAGGSGLSFLKLAAGGRAASMGEAMTGSVHGAAAGHYNPALYADADTDAEIVFAHTVWVQEMRHEFLGARVPFGTDDAFGFNLISSSVGEIEIRTRPGPPQATFTARNLAVAASYAHRFLPSLRAGVTVRFLYEKILVDDATGAGVDLGLAWESPVEGVTFGASVMNLGGMNPLRTESTRLPLTVRAGGAYVLPVDATEVGALVAADVVHLTREGDTNLLTGAEVTILGHLALRGGYQFGIEGRGLSLGVGIRYGLFTLEYGFMQLREDLGEGHTVGLAVGF
jgi:hypothetical protein